MNNEQFRQLLLSKSSNSSSSSKDGTSSTPSSSTARPLALGSKLRPSIPMTPRPGSTASARIDFAKQLAERNQAFEQQTQKQQMKFKASAPKGVKFAPGYVDRAKQRQEEEDERVRRIRALEESYKKGEIDRETYEKLQVEIAGGDLETTGLVKGLDYKLLERIRRGEDVWGGNKDKGKEEKEGGQEEEQPEDDADAILEQLESTEVKAITREKTQKKGQFATTGLVPGQKRTRNQILAEFKAQREAAKAKQQSSLGSRFKKIGEQKTPGTRIERDSKGREVLIIIDEDGHERRKVRKLDTQEEREEDERTRLEREKEREALASGKVLGMEVPEYYRRQQEEKKEEEEDGEINIFDDVGSDYDPLAELEGSGDESGEDKEEKKRKEPKETENKEASEEPEAPPPPRNYFKDSKSELLSREEYKAPSLDDPAFLAALRKAKAAGLLEKKEEERKAAEREERLRKKLEELHRDDEDLDLGFGSSRLEDDADMEEGHVKLSAWDDDDDDDDDGAGGGGKKGKRKRGKKKMDKNKFEDVMKVIQQRKASG